MLIALEEHNTMPCTEWVVIQYLSQEIYYFGISLEKLLPLWVSSDIPILLLQLSIQWN